MATEAKISVIFSTYNSPKWLEKVLWGFDCQTDDNFEIVVADDGSKEDTQRVIEKFSAQSSVPVKHVWQEDDGFQKCKILNKAIVEAEGEYLVFTDGDCVPRNDFIAVHRQQAEAGRFLSGGYLKLNMPVSQKITREDIKYGRCFVPAWLRDNGMPSTKGFMKLNAGRLAGLLNKITPTKPTWNGHNASCFKSDALRINGYDERLRYGGLDREFGERLENAGIAGKQIRYSAVVVHLDHARGYESKETWQNNRDIRQAVKDGKLVETQFGIKQHRL
ncbi:glycosyltransferase family 2 protein [Saccharophagus degradans]|uniref:glycosyltransferase family 2 protein n=1 Tax=Saccharophagus degradans TaxID=86304 RepID=UPI00247828F4|nr:glycosyltransferase family 2 protein [Saccharophagus degradans]WGO98821.1 glycosyltransferase family 2 protein [Saccharophagus degradans]